MNWVGQSFKEAWRWIVGAGVIASIIAYLETSLKLGRLELGIIGLLVGLTIIIRALYALGGHLSHIDRRMEKGFSGMETGFTELKEIIKSPNPGSGSRSQPQKEERERPKLSGNGALAGMLAGVGLGMGFGPLGIIIGGIVGAIIGNAIEYSDMQKWQKP